MGVLRIRSLHLEEDRVLVQIQTDHQVLPAYDALPKAGQIYSRKPHSSMLPRVVVEHWTALAVILALR